VGHRWSETVYIRADRPAASRAARGRDAHREGWTL